MQKWFERIPTRYLSPYVALADIFVWLGGLPFELYLRGAVAQHQHDPVLLVVILLLNIALAGFVIVSVAATSELLRRGLTRTVRG